MDLRKYTKNEEKKENKIYTKIIDNLDFKIYKNKNKIQFLIKTKKGLEKIKKFMFFSTSNYILCEDKNIAQKFFKKALKEKAEGIMFKNIDSKYKSGLRTGSITKFKSFKEPIDVVIVGAEFGKGKRQGYFSSFIVAVLDNLNLDEQKPFLKIGKVSSGILEFGEKSHTLENLTNILKPLKIKEEKNIVWLKPKIILEIKYQQIQKSTKYDSGYALRFPTIQRLREDKLLDEINTIDDIKNLSEN